MNVRPLCFLILAFAVGLGVQAEPTLEDRFVHPPAAARPWVFWFWADGNVTREGITADLEAMQRVGIGGVAFMEVDQAVPKGPVRFMTAPWQELFGFAVHEAKRLGLQVDLNNDAGWTGSGGPWVDGAHSMQKVVWSETTVTGPTHFDAMVAPPTVVANYYADIALLAFPTPDPKARIERFASKSGLGLVSSPAPGSEVGTAGIDRAQIVDLTARMQDGRLAWDVPAGQWTLLRVGHTSTGKTNYPAVAEGQGLEVDKLSRDAFDGHYDAFTKKMLPLTGAAGTGVGLTAVHIDSWEVGYQNWTARFRDEFKARRGYDPVPWLPTFTGRVVGDASRSERFLWDVRRTISELLNDNYATRMAERAHADGRVFTLEAYRNGPFDCLSYGGRGDVPVGEFWMSKDPANLHPSVKTMASAAHIYGKPVVGAEAFTATDAMGKQRNHPYSMKAIGDAAFCAGINHFIFHRYAMQPWTDDRKPGMTMGPWGVEYERTATWWEQTKPWHEYVTRCSYLLQQGTFVADFCYLQSEEGINNPTLPSEVNPALPLGFDYDFCSDEVVRNRMSVREGRVCLPDGLSYRVLVLPTQRLMRPELLRKIRDLVEQGAVVFGRPPVHSPSLAGYPECDAQLQALVRDLWGEKAASERGEHSFGKGRVLWASSLADIAPELSLTPDFAWRPAPGAEDPTIRYLHRALPDRDVFFVANLSAIPARIVASLRVGRGAVELWDAERATILPAAVYQFADGRLCLPLDFAPRGSVFVVIKKTAGPAMSPIVAIAGGGQTLAECASVAAPVVVPERKAGPKLSGTFTLAAWVRPAAETALPAEAATGSNAYSVPRNDVLFPPPVHELLNDPGVAGAGFAVGTNGVTVLEHGDHHFPATLVYRGSIADWTHVAVVFDDGQPKLYLDGKLVRTGRRSGVTLYSGVDVAHGREVEPFRGTHSAVIQFDRALNADEIVGLMRTLPRTPAPPPPVPPVESVYEPAPLRLDGTRAWVASNGTFAFTLADARTTRVEVNDVPRPVNVGGEWQLRFPAGWGAPTEVFLPKLISWSDHDDPGVRYFSGTATYRRTLSVPSEFAQAGRRVWLDLGDVQVIAAVKINGRDVGTLWKPPFRIDVTDAVHAGDNALEIAVTNLWVNRLIGDEQRPADREWTKVPHRGGYALKEYPEWFKRGERSPTGRVTFATWKHYEKDAPLLPSGLLGPVRLRCEQELPLGSVTSAAHVR